MPRLNRSANRSYIRRMRMALTFLVAAAIFSTSGRAQDTQTYPTSHGAIFEITRTDLLCGTATETFSGVFEVFPSPVAVMFFGVPSQAGSNTVVALVSAPTTTVTPIGALLGMPGSPCALSVDFNSLFSLPMPQVGANNSVSFPVNDSSGSLWPLGLSIRVHPLRFGPGELSTFHALDVTRIN